MDIKGSRGVDKENLVQAVIIADSYDHNFSPTCDSSPLCLMPLVNRPMLDYTLECLSAAGVQEVILFCSSYADKIKDYVKADRWGRMSVSLVVSEGCRSLGDAMRDLDAKAVIRTDFILLSGTVVGSLNLIPILEKHKKVQKTDKGAAMTVVYKDCGNKTRHRLDELYLAIDSKTDRILYHSKAPSSTAIPPSTIEHIPLEVVLERSGLDVRCDLVDTGVSICSVSVPPLFSDNFDFQTREDFLRGLLMNEEILASTLYAHVLPPPQYAAEVTHWFTYHSISRDIIHRWTYPQVPGGFIDDMYSYRFGNIYLQNDVSMETGSKLVQDVVIGRGTCVGANTRVSSSVIGKSCRISKDVTISNSHLFSNVTVEAGSVVEYCVLGDGCVVKSGAKLKFCILGAGVVIPADKSINRLRLQSTPLDKDDDGVGEKAYEYKGCDEGEDAVSVSLDSSAADDEGLGGVEWIGLEPVQPIEYLEYDEVHSDDEQDSNSLAASQPDDTNLFFSEVVDSLSRGLEDKLPCDNLVLEVNSSRYAYNVSLREVNYHVSRAVLSLSPVDSGQLKWEVMKSTVDYLLPLLTNYIKNRDAMADCLSAIEDVSECKEEVKVLIVKLLSYLYEKDLLSEDSIIEWHANPRDSSTFSTLLRKQVMPFIKWLEEADEQSDSDD